MFHLLPSLCFHMLPLVLVAKGLLGTNAQIWVLLSGCMYIWQRGGFSRASVYEQRIGWLCKKRCSAFYLFCDDAIFDLHLNTCLIAVIGASAMPKQSGSGKRP